MPFVCPATGEMATSFDASTVKSETSPKTLVSVTVTYSQSAVTGKQERWTWKEDVELTSAEAEQKVKMAASGATLIGPQ